MISRITTLKLKQLKISKLINSYLKKYINNKEIYSDFTKIRELTDEQDKLLDIE